MLRGAFDRRMLRRSLLPRKLHDSVPARSRSARGASAFQWRPPGLPALRGPEPRVQRPLPVHRRRRRDGQHAGMGVRPLPLRILPAGSPRDRRDPRRAAAPFHGSRRPSPSSPQEEQLTPRSAVAVRTSGPRPSTCRVSAPGSTIEVRRRSYTGECCTVPAPGTLLQSGAASAHGDPDEASADRCRIFRIVHPDGHARRGPGRRPPGLPEVRLRSAVESGA